LPNAKVEHFSSRACCLKPHFVAATFLYLPIGDLFADRLTVGYEIAKLFGGGVLLFADQKVLVSFVIRGGQA
jgi:hypothetical protein